MNKIMLLAVAGAMALPAMASATTYGTLGDFAFNGFSQGLGACSFNGGCTSVAANRTGLGKAFDGSLADGSFHSLGVYGIASFEVNPGEAITQVLTMETTFSNNGGPGWPEKVGLFFSNSLNAAGIASWSADLAADVGAISNPNIANYAGGDGANFAAVDGSDLAGLLRGNVISDGVLGAIFSNDQAAGFDIGTAGGVSVNASNAGSNGWSYEITIDPSLFGSYTFLTLVDLTMSDDPEFWQSRSGDGWDLGELQVATVPEPGTWAMLLVGLTGMGLAWRRPRAKRV